METRANYALIGLFTLATIAAALGFVVWFARLAEGTKADHYQVVFSGSVSGLTVGSSVLFNGLRVGQVETLDLFPGDPSRVIGVIKVKDGTPVKVDTRARLEFQGFTGGAYVQLYGGSATTALLEPQNGEKLATIYSERSELQNLVDGARDTVTQAAQTLHHVDQWLSDNESGVTATIKNVQVFTQALADNSGNVSDFLKTTGDAAKSISRLSDNLNNMSGDLQALLKAVDPAKIEHVVGNVSDASDQLTAFTKTFDAAKAQRSIDNIEAFTQALADARQPLTSFATDASALTAKLNAMAPKLEASLDGLQKLTAAIDGKKVGQVVDNIDRFTTTLGNNSGELDGILKDTHALSAQLKDIAPKLAAAVDSFNRVAGAVDTEKVNHVIGNVDKFATALGDSTPKVQAFVDDAGDVGKKVNAAADQLDGILKNITAMTTSSESKGMFNEITEAARSVTDGAKAVGVLAKNLDDRTAVLTKNLDQFTGSGLRDYKQIAVDGQRTLQSIQRTLNSLQRNPQQLIFGPKSNIPDFKGN